VFDVTLGRGGLDALRLGLLSGSDITSTLQKYALRVIATDHHVVVTGQHNEHMVTSAVDDSFFVVK